MKLTPTIIADLVVIEPTVFEDQRGYFMESYQHLLITRHMAAWTRLLAETIDWPLVFRGYTVVFAANITLFTLGYAVFESRDLKS